MTPLTTWIRGPTLQAVGDPCPGTWDPDSNACLLSTRARVEERRTDVVLVVAGREFKAPTQAGPLLRALVDGHTVRLAKLLDQVAQRPRAKLVEVGVLAIELGQVRPRGGVCGARVCSTP
jgi:hypothetical protein